jgi:hypothetical protein
VSSLLKIQAGRVSNVVASAYVGDNDLLFYDETGVLRLGDGVTPGGIPLNFNANGSSSTVFNSFLPGITNLYSLGTPSAQWKTLYLSSSTFYVGGNTVTISNTGTLLINGIQIGGSTTNIITTGTSTIIIGYTGSQGIQGPIGYTGSAGSGTGSSTPVTVKPNVGLAVTNNTLTTVYNTLIGDDVQSIALGGAAAQSASVWKSKNIVEVLDTILFPDVLPTYTIPTTTLTGTSGTREIGSSLTQALTFTGVENDAGAFTALTMSQGSTQLATINSPTATSTTDIPAQFGYVDPNNPNRSYSLSYTDIFTIVAGNSIWNATGTYLAGLAKLNNKGVADTRAAQVRNVNAPQSASSLSSSVTVTGIYPYFWGKSNTQPTASSIAATIAAGTANKVLSPADSTVTVTYNAVGEYVWLAHAASYTNKTKCYNTELNQGNIGPGNFILTPVVTAVTSPESYWSGVSFDIYISDGATTTNGALQFRNS